MKEKKILTAYYSHMRHTAAVAKQINSAAGGDIVSIEIQKPYSKSYFGTLIPAGLDIIRNTKPALSGNIDISGYDIIFAGSPVWWLTVAPPMVSFLNGNDFSGKILVPFCTSGGNEGRFFRNFKKNSNGAKVLNGIGFTGKDFKNPGALKDKLDIWLSETEKQI